MATGIALKPIASRRPAPIPVLGSEEYIEEANQRIQQSAENVFLVRCTPTGWTSITRDLLKRLAGEGKGELNIGSALPPNRLPYLHPDSPLEMALRYVYQTPLVPVVSRADFRRLEGVISSDAVLNKYRMVSRDNELGGNQLPTYLA